MTIDFFRRYDLNLLLLLHILLEERSVTAAARRLGQTQSAVSRSLGRLREQLDDELLVRAGGEMIPTPRALGMKAPLERLLHELGLLLEPPLPVVPKRIEREFRIATADYPTAVLVPPLLKLLKKEAPKAALRVDALRPNSEHRLSIGEIDLMITPKRGAMAGVIWSNVLRDRLVTIVRRSHPRIRRKPTLKQYLGEQHLLVAPEPGDAEGVLDRVLAAHGHRRTVTLRVASFAVAPLIVATSDLLATLPERAATPVANAFRLSVFPPPSRLDASIETSMGWHERVRRDPIHAWFRGLVVKAASA